jgi:putative hemolysin
MEDPNQILFQILIILALVLFNAFFAAAEIALVSVRRTRIKQLIEEGDLRAKTVQKLLEKPTSFMATVQIGVTLVGFLASAFAAVSIAQEPTKWLISLGLDKSTANGLAVFAITLIVGFISLVFGEIAPKSLAMQHAEKLALSFAGTINFLSIIALPAVKVVSFFSDLVVRPFGGHVKFSSPILTEEELKMLVEAGEEEGVIEEDEKEMIHSIFDFTDTVVRQVMVPRTDMHSVSITSSLDELLEVIINQGHSRIPVYEENTDNIKGVLYAKDLLVYLKEDKSSFDINRILRPAYFIPETKEVNDLLTEFKRGNIHMAIVRDEYGGTAGLVTVEDLIEEIVGDIRDEYDNAEEPQINYIDENNSIVSARMRVEDVNEQMNIEIPIGEQYDTVGGFVFDLFGKQP